MAKLENKLRSREHNLDKKIEILERKEGEIEKEISDLEAQDHKYKKLIKETEESLENYRRLLNQTAKMSAEEAKRQLMKSMEDVAKSEIEEKLAQLEEESKKKG